MALRGAHRISADDVREQVHRIGAHSGNDRRAFAMEYELYRAVLAAIAQGGIREEDARYLALTALQSQKYGFERNTA